MNEAIAAQLKAVRKAAGLTQIDLAEALGVNNSYVSLLESAKRNLDLDDFVRWCRACDQDPAVVLTAGLMSVEGDDLDE